MVHFEQLIALLHVFQLMAISKEVTELDSRPVNERFLGRDQERMNTIHRFIEGNYHRNISVNEMAAMVHLSTAAFCRYFKKTTRMTFTDFLNQYRVNQARKMLLHDKNVTEACFESGFENLSYFSRTFKRFSGENPSQFRKKLATH
jgi:AraC-like DNA-binding protein